MLYAIRCETHLAAATSWPRKAMKTFMRPGVEVFTISAALVETGTGPKDLGIAGARTQKARNHG